MFSKTTQGDLNGFLDAGSHIQGELHFEDTFRVDGRIEGGVVSEGVLIVGDRGEIEGEIKVRRVYVSGIVRGRVEAGEYLEITPSGRVFADLEVPNLKIEEGAVFEGRCTMKVTAAEAAAKPQPTAAQPSAAQPSAAQPSAAQPSAAQPSAAQPKDDEDDTPSNVTRLPLAKP